MLIHQYICQPDTEYRELVRTAASSGDFDTIDGAFAYASTRGVELMLETLRAELDLSSCKQRWLLGFDWCRTEPDAAALLQAQRRSNVRVVDGEFVVGRRGCTPRTPWHPKVLLLRGKDISAVVIGSGNLSRNGMTGGHEVGQVTVVRSPKNAAERAIRDQSREMSKWFDRNWSGSARLARVEDAYEARYREMVRTTPPVIDDDTVPVKRRTWITEERLRKVRAADHLWIEAGNLHHNRGPGKPGNQLMMTPMTRVYFGFEARDVPTDTTLGSIAISYSGDVRWECSLRFSNNSMDVLTLPIPGMEGPTAYDQKTLLLTAREENRQVVYDLTLGTPTDRATWKQRSAAADTSFAMQGGQGRAWGVF